MAEKKDKILFNCSALLLKTVLFILFFGKTIFRYELVRSKLHFKTYLFFP